MQEFKKCCVLAERSELPKVMIVSKNRKRIQKFSSKLVDNARWDKSGQLMLP